MKTHLKLVFVSLKCFQRASCLANFKFFVPEITETYTSTIKAIGQTTHVRCWVLGAQSMIDRMLELCTKSQGGVSFMLLMKFYSNYFIF